jgi:hypothetical protein
LVLSGFLDLSLQMVCPLLSLLACDTLPLFFPFLAGLLLGL